MSNSSTNLITAGYKGKIGNQMVIKRRNGKTVLASRPNRFEHPVSTAQQAVKDKFRAAAKYARSILQNPEYFLAYAAMAGPGRSAYSVAVTDYLHNPVIESIDLTMYKGTTGDPVKILASDFLIVVSVHVTIKDANGNEVENGEAQKNAENNSLSYAATATVSPYLGVTVTVQAYDLPGHYTEMTVTKS